MKNSWAYLIILCFIISCTKQIKPSDEFIQQEGQEQGLWQTAAKGAPVTTQFKQYTIRAGQHYCDQNSFKSVKTSEMKFMVRFDNTAVYQTVDPWNQYDINKLWGFSEGLNHQYNSARIGWHGMMEHYDCMLIPIKMEWFNTRKLLLLLLVQILPAA